MNYDQYSDIEKHYTNKIYPHLHQRFNTISFVEYLKYISYCSTFKWVKSPDTCYLTHFKIPIDAEKFVAKYEDKCVNFYSPMKPEDGYMRIIYQISPTLHMEMGYWIWMETHTIHSYLMPVICYSNRKEYDNFKLSIQKFIKIGDTQDTNRPIFQATQP